MQCSRSFPFCYNTKQRGRNSEQDRVSTTCQQQLVVSGDLAQLAQQLAVKVLEAVALIHYNVLPFVPLQQLTVSNDNLIGGDNDWELG